MIVSHNAYVTSQTVNVYTSHIGGFAVKCASIPLEAKNGYMGVLRLYKGIASIMDMPAAHTDKRKEGLYSPSYSCC